MALFDLFIFSAGILLHSVYCKIPGIQAICRKPYSYYFTFTDQIQTETGLPGAGIVGSAGIICWFGNSSFLCEFFSAVGFL